MVAGYWGGVMVITRVPRRMKSMRWGMWIKESEKRISFSGKKFYGSCRHWFLAQTMKVVITWPTRNGSTWSPCHTHSRKELGKPSIYPSCFEISHSSFFFVQACWLTRYFFRCPFHLEGVEVFSCGVCLWCRLPGQALATGEHVWLIEANKSANNHICTRSHLAKVRKNPRST